jgi:hypothetical protein
MRRFAKQRCLKFCLLRFELLLQKISLRGRECVHRRLLGLAFQALPIGWQRNEHAVMLERRR